METKVIVYRQKTVMTKLAFNGSALFEAFCSEPNVCL